MAPINHNSYIWDQHRECYDREQIPTANVVYYQGLMQKFSSKIGQERWTEKLMLFSSIYRISCLNLFDLDEQQLLHDLIIILSGAG